MTPITWKGQHAEPELTVAPSVDAVSFHGGGFAIERWGLTLQLDGQTRSAAVAGPSGLEAGPSSIVWRCSFDPHAVDWTVEFAVLGSTVTVSSTIANRGDRTVRLGRATLLDATAVVAGAADDDVVLLPTVPYARQFVYRLDDPQLPRLSKTNLQLVNSSRGASLRLGFLTFQRANTEVSYIPSTRSGRAELTELRASCDFAGWPLAPGASTVTETFQISCCDDPYQQMEEWAARAADLIGVTVWPSPPVGYLGWSWVDCVNGTRNYEDVTLDVLDAINRRLPGFGVDYLWVSMSNIDGSLPGNWLEWNNRCIPSGREEFLRQVSQRGFRPGFWIAPFYLCSSLDEQMAQLQDAILTSPDGSPMVVCPQWNHGDAGLLPPDERPRLYALDPSHPKVLDYARRLFATYREWGIRYYMVDFLEAGAGNIHRFPYVDHFDQSLVAGPEVYSGFLRAIKEAAGPDAYLLSSSGPTHHNAGLVDGVRVGNDFGEGRPLAVGAFFYPATYVINQIDFWTGPEYALVNQGANYHTHRRLYLNDSGNVLTVDRPIPLSHARIAATIHALSGGGTMLGDDIRAIAEDRLSLIKKTLPRCADVARPVDLFTSPFPVGPRVFWRHVDRGSDSYDVVALYNLRPDPVKAEVDLGRIGLPAGRQRLLWDFWNEEFIGYADDQLATWVERESVKVIRITAKTGAPTIVGTDMHIMMGEVEITDATYTPDTMILHISARRPPGETGTIFVWAPDNVHVINFDGLHIAKDSRDNSLIIGVPLAFDEDGKAAREIRFGPLSDVLDLASLNLA